MAAVVVGAAGALGRELVCALQSSGIAVLCVDRAAGDGASVTVASTADYPDAARRAADWARAQKGRTSVFCVAGGWSAGALDSVDALFAGADALWAQNGMSALLAAAVARLCGASLLVLTGAAAAAGPTPAFPAYGMAKAATAHLVGSAAAAMPRAVVAAIAPEVIDTPANRAAMPNASRDTWTPAADIAQRLCAWAHGQDLPRTGAVVSVQTRGGATTFTLA